MLNVYSLCELWNAVVSRFTKAQNELLRNIAAPYHDDKTPETRAFGIIPSLCPASACPWKSIQALETDMKTNHQQILNEVKVLIRRGYCGVAMADLDEVQREAFREQQTWKIMSVKFFNQYADTDLPTLTRICKKHRRIISLLHVSCMAPGTELKTHVGITTSVLRYHYGLQIPRGPCGLVVQGTPFKWTNGEGVIWDDMLPHMALNRSDEVRMVVFADLYRPGMPFVIRVGNSLIHWVAARSNHIKSIQKRLAAGGALAGLRHHQEKDQ